MPCGRAAATSATPWRRTSRAGYAIAKPYRGKGYGKELLRLLIAQARAMGITENLLVTVRLNNIPSRRTAEACGGILVKENDERAFYEFPA